MVFGYLLTLDSVVDSDKLGDKEYIQKFINELVEKLEMKKMCDTVFIYFEDNDYNRDRDIVGYTVFQCISLSNITMHINEISKTIYLDVFSCGFVDEIMVFLLFTDYFKCKKLKKRMIERDAKN